MVRQAHHERRDKIFLLKRFLSLDSFPRRWLDQGRQTATPSTSLIQTENVKKKEN